TERLMMRMVAKEGEVAKTAKLYRRLDEKRAGYIEEMGVKFYPLDHSTASLDDRTDPDVYSFSGLSVTTSLHSMLGNLQSLDVIEEDENSTSSNDEERRDPFLLKRKIRKVERKQEQIVAQKGKKGKSKKLYKRLEEKRIQYKKELEGTSPGKAAHSPSKARKTLRRRVEQAISLMQTTLEETGEANDDQALKASSSEQQSPSAEKTSTLACQHVGKWSSPLNRSSHTGASDELKMTIHSLESVYL
ncbi:MAG: hypothetical protein SGILL_007383, partial [Bacillariaceae sp.]